LHRNPGARPNQISRCWRLCSPLPASRPGDERRPRSSESSCTGCVARAPPVLRSWSWRICSGRTQPACKSWTMFCGPIFRSQPLLWLLALGRPEVEERFPGLWGEAHGRVHPAGILAPQGRAKPAALAGSPADRRSRALRARPLGRQPHVLGGDGRRPRSRPFGSPRRRAGRGRSPFRLPVARGSAGLARAASLYGDKFFSTEALVAVLGEASRREMGEWLENLVMRDLVQRQADGSEVAYRRAQQAGAREGGLPRGMLTSADRVLGRPAGHVPGCKAPGGPPARDTSSGPVIADRPAGGDGKLRPPSRRFVAG